MAGQRGALCVAPQPPRVQVCGERVRPFDHLGVAVTLFSPYYQLLIRNRGCDGFRDGWHRELRCGVIHDCVHTRSRSSVVVMVASSDRVFAMMASPYSVGMPATASRGTTTR